MARFLRQAITVGPVPVRPAGGVARHAPGVGDGGQVGEQVGGFGVLERAGIAEGGQPRRDWG
jgi:hypothetical protein